ncbi:MAG: hypothetical protein FJX23_09110 [Alphaproteobacteria bacterium]|nr:hypothetical protein [Alphaproteobacteria bacterium]
MAEDRADPKYVEQLANSAAVLNAVRVAGQHLTGYTPPAQPSAQPAYKPESSGLTNAPLVAKAQTVSHSISTPGQGMEMQVGTGAMHQAQQDALEIERAMQKMLVLGAESPDKAKDGKGKEGASAEAATEKGAEAAPAVNAAVLTNLVEKDTRSRINEVTGQTTDQQQPAQQQQQAKAAEEAKKTAVVEPGKKVKLSGLDKSTADAVNNLQKQFGKGKDDKDKPKVGMVSNSSVTKPPSTPKRPEPPVGHRPKAPAHAGPRGK